MYFPEENEQQQQQQQHLFLVREEKRICFSWWEKRNGAKKVIVHPTNAMAKAKAEQKRGFVRAKAKAMPEKRGERISFDFPFS